MATTKGQRQLEAYIRQHCPEGWRAGERGRRATALPALSAVDKALIYHYSEDGYQALNKSLHASGGDNSTLFGQGLVAALAKLPAYEGLAYSGVYLRPEQVQHYRACALSGQFVSWPAFLSASQKEMIAWQYLSGEKKCLFVIQSRTGRLIAEISKYGVDGQNEYEVLFAPNTSFEVSALTNETGYTRIVLDEL